MRPTKNRVYCYGCQRSKMLFESKEKADKFITYNSEGMLEENGKAPVRSYYCEMCGGYHVTSNPSLVAGESLNQRDQRMIEQFANYNKGADEHKKILEEISRKTDLAKRQMYLGHFQSIEQLYEDFQIDQKFLFSIPSAFRAKYIQRHQMVEMLKEVALQMDELLKLPKEEISQIIAFEEPSKREKTLATIINSFFIISECNECIDEIELLIKEKNWDEAQNKLTLFKSNMPEEKGTPIFKEYVSGFQKDILLLEKAIREKKNIVTKR